MKNTKKNPIVGKKVYTLTIVPTVAWRCTTIEVYTSFRKAINAARREYKNAGYVSDMVWKDMEKELNEMNYFYNPAMFSGDKFLIDSVTIR